MEQESGTPLQEFVRSTIENVKAGLPTGFRLEKSIEFELTVVDMGEAKGGLDLRVVRVGGAVSSEKVQRIKFSVAEGEDFIAEAQKKMLGRMGRR